MPSPENGIRQPIDASLLANPMPISVIGETDSIDFLHAYLIHEHAISFQIPIGIGNENKDLILVEIDKRDIKTGTLHIGQLKDRVLSVAAAKFLDQITP